MSDQPPLFEIIEQLHKGETKYFIKDAFSILNGPYETVEEAQMDVPQRIDLQYPLDLKGGF